MSKDMTIKLVLDTIVYAMQKKRSLQSCTSTVTKERNIFHEYYMLTKSSGTPSMSRQENLYDNVLTKNFFSILK